MFTHEELTDKSKQHHESARELKIAKLGAYIGSLSGLAMMGFGAYYLSQGEISGAVMIASGGILAGHIALSLPDIEGRIEGHERLEFLYDESAQLTQERSS